MNFDHIKSKYQENTNLCHMNTHSFIIQIKTEDFYKGIAENIEKWFDTWNYSEDRKILITRGKNKEKVASLKDTLGGTIMAEFVAVIARAYASLIDDDSENKNVKGTKKCVIKRLLKLINYKNCHSDNEIILKSQKNLKNIYHNV